MAKIYQTENFKKRWQQLSVYEQLGNIGDEFERALRWKQKKQQPMFENASARMLELFDLTLTDKRWDNYRLKEITSACEVAYAELFDNDPNLSGNPEGLKRYFLQFAILARKNQL